MRNVKIGAIFVLLIALYAQLSAAQQAPGAGFASAEDASRALYETVRSNDQIALEMILGADNQFISGDDPAQERREREQFGRKFDEMHRLVRKSDGTSVLYVGAENWPFPFPLTRDNAGWHFDAKAGMEEVLARLIGEDELAAIATSRMLATQQDEKQEVPFHGYYFRRLDQQKVIAYPAQYRVTGVMSFVAGADNVVFEKDLGPRTAEVARTMERLDSLSTWHRIE
jgi:Txe/YoeB family toxin of Txe-Axe toxin-antitoxin module